MISEDFASWLNNAALVGIVVLAVVTAILTYVSFWAGNIKQTYVEQRANAAFQRSERRVLDDPHSQILTDGLAAVKDKEVVIFEWNSSNNETDLFARRILSAMRAGYPRDKIQDSGIDNYRTPDGVTVRVNNDNVGRMIGEAFVKAGLVKSALPLIMTPTSPKVVAYVTIGLKPFVPTPK